MSRKGRWVFGSLAVATAVAAGAWSWQAERVDAASIVASAERLVASLTGTATPERVTGGDRGSSGVTGKAPANAKASGNAAGSSGPPLPVVTVSRPLLREITEWDEYTGRFDAVEAVEVRARVAGYLTEVHFKDGQTVKQGDLLFVIDSRPFERALDQARAELALAETRLANTARDVERGRPLVDRKIMSEKVFDDRESAKREAAAQVEVARAKVRTAELEIAFTRVSAPTSGRIGRSLVARGNFLVGGGTSNPTLLTTIVSQDPIHIYFDISENNYIKYKRSTGNGGVAGNALGAAVEVALPDEKGFPHKGTLDFIDNRLDQGTGTLRARGVVPNPAALFSPGMFARVRLAGSAARPSLLVPDAAVATDQTSKLLLVVGADGTVARKRVTLGPRIGTLRVVTQGIEADEWVIVKGLQSARAGIKVRTERKPLELSAAPGSADGGQLGTPPRSTQ
jgi:RND family efflux transporter MFP subunit